MSRMLRTNCSQAARALRPSRSPCSFGLKTKEHPASQRRVGPSTHSLCGSEPPARAASQRPAFICISDAYGMWRPRHELQFSFGGGMGTGASLSLEEKRKHEATTTPETLH